MHQTELKSRRRRLGFTQAELAGRLGVNVNTVARWERGANIPPYLALALQQLQLQIEEEWRAMTNEERYARSERVAVRLRQEAEQRWEKMTEDERDAVRFWLPTRD